MDQPTLKPAPEGRNFAARRARKANTRRRLVEAAIDLIRKEGFARMSIDSIAARAGTNRTTFYLHFHNKADLVLDIAEQVRTDAQGALDKLHLNGLTLESVAAWIGAVEAIYQRHSELIDAMQSALATDRKSAAMFDRIAGSYLRGLAMQAEPSRREALPSRLLAAYLLVERYMFYRAIREYPLGGDAMRSELAEIVFDMLRDRAG